MKSQVSPKLRKVFGNEEEKNIILTKHHFRMQKTESFTRYKLDVNPAEDEYLTSLWMKQNEFGTKKTETSFLDLW